MHLHPAQLGRVDVRPHGRTDASGVSSAKATRMLGFRPTRSWRNYIDEDGRPLAGGRSAARTGA
jgi:hypothetical protein